MGDGGGANDPYRHGQNLNSLLGKMLRIDVDKPAGGKAYGIPSDNPFLNKAGAQPEIWAYGLRNPWRFSFDVDTGALYAADVGQDHEEEIDLIEKGGNYGWAVMEGKLCTPGVNRRCDQGAFKLPLWTYVRSEGFSITGGYVYRGRAIPALCGAYLYADYVTGNIWGLRQQNHRVLTQRLLLSTQLHLSSFGVDGEQGLYAIDHGGGQIFKFTAKNSK